MKEKSAFIAIIGRPNVGKSSLMNKVLGQKVAIVSNKPQTTRTKIMGVMTKGAVQTVFIDTPGFHKPRNELDKNMNKAVGEGMADVDAAILVVEAVTPFKLDPGSIPPGEIELLKELKKRKIKSILVINKIDTVPAENLFPVIAMYKERFDFTEIIPISAKEGDGVELVLDQVEKFIPEGYPLFPEDMVSDQPERAMIAEIIREKLLNSLNREVPHGTAVEITKFSERENEIIDVCATIYCEKDSHKGIIIGKRGAMLKKISSESREEIERFMGTKVYLETWVKVKENWRESDFLLRNFGYE